MSKIEQTMGFPPGISQGRCNELDIREEFYINFLSGSFHLLKDTMSSHNLIYWIAVFYSVNNSNSNPKQFCTCFSISVRAPVFFEWRKPKTPCTKCPEEAVLFCTACSMKLCEIHKEVSIYFTIAIIIQDFKCLSLFEYAY